MALHREDSSTDSADEFSLDELHESLNSLKRDGQALQQHLDNLATTGALADQSETVAELARLLRETTNATIASCTDYIEAIEIQEKKWEKALQRERQKRHRLVVMVEQLAQQQTKLEEAAHHIISTTNIVLEEPIALTLTEAILIGSSSDEEDVLLTGPNSCERSKSRRCIIPEKPNYPVDLWSIMKKCIGKDLWKISMPVSFNEPISMCQRLAEDYEYAELLDIAAECSDPCEQLAYVAAFSISSYSTTADRTGKPFNPLLGETFEFDRMDDLGWRSISEQVSHHPPVTAIHCEGKAWTSWQDISVTSRFRGKDIQLAPWGVVNVLFASGHKYAWRKVTTTVHNIVVGSLWIDHYGDADIVGQNNANGLKCTVKYVPYSYFSREPQRKVHAVIMNEANEPKWILRGNWDTKVEIARVRKIPKNSATPETEKYTTIWNRRLPPEDSVKYYNFTVLACQLNEMEDGIAPTDSRLRPDQRLMEEGLWDESNLVKTRLEDGQRVREKSIVTETLLAAAEGRPSMFAPHEPIWFNKLIDPDTGKVVYAYKGTYWEHKQKQDWSICPEIFADC